MVENNIYSVLTFFNTYYLDDKNNSFSFVKSIYFSIYISKGVVSLFFPPNLLQ